MNPRNDEKVVANAKLVMGLLENLPSGRKEAVKKMMEGKVGESYFTAPASSREEFHSCYPGGLMQHSLNVVRNMKNLANAVCKGKYTEDTLIFVGLFHDLGKVGDGVNEYYIPQKSDWHRNKGMLYEINPECVHMPTSERGLYILQMHGIALSADEYLSIRLNDGQYDPTNASYKMREPNLALITHWADIWSTKQEK